MANVVSGFIANAENYNVPPNQTLLVLSVATWDRQNMNGAVFSISAPGQTTETATAGADGRVTKLVASGYTYTVTLTHSGDYLDDGPQTVVARSEEVAWVNFVLDRPAVEVHTNVTASTWASDSTYADFPYKCAIAMSGVTANDVAWVTFGVDEALSGDYAPVCDTYAGGVYLYSSKNTSITVPNITILRMA